MEIDKCTCLWWPEDDERRLLEFLIVHMCFPEVGGDSVVGVLCLEFLRAKLPHKQRVSWLADLTSHVVCQDVCVNVRALEEVNLLLGRPFPVH